MSYIVINQGVIKHMEDIRMEEWKLAQEGVVTLLNLSNLSFYCHSTNNWMSIVTVENSSTKKIAKKVIDRLDIDKIRTIAHEIFMETKIDIEYQEHVRDYLLFAALEEFLKRNKIDPGYKIKK